MFLQLHIAQGAPMTVPGTQIYLQVLHNLIWTYVTFTCPIPMQTIIKNPAYIANGRIDPMRKKRNRANTFSDHCIGS